MRKLASIQKITALNPIEGADKILVADVLGWKVVVEKGKFSSGDLVVYCEIDSILPNLPQFAFLEKNKFRIKTIRLRGQISQGICFTIDDAFRGLKKPADLQEGTDVTQALGIKKYEPNIDNIIDKADSFAATQPKWVKQYLPKALVKFIYRRAPRLAKWLFMPKDNRLPFPDFIPKTDEERVQSMESDLLAKIVQEPLSATEKVDGSSCTIYCYRGKFGVCSRNKELKEDDSAYWIATRKFNLKEKLTKLCKEEGQDLALQGEILGPSIQSNKYRLHEIDLYLFNVYFIKQGKYGSNEIVAQYAKKLDLHVVPTIYTQVSLKGKSVEEIVLMSDGKSKLNEDTLREGLVWRTTRDGKFKGYSFKAVSNKFLLKNPED